MAEERPVLESTERRRRRREMKKKKAQRRRRIFAAVFLLIIILVLVVLGIVGILRWWKDRQTPEVRSYFQSKTMVQSLAADAADRIIHAPRGASLKTVTDDYGDEVLADPGNLTVLVNKEYHLSRSFEPEDLVDVEIPFAPGRSSDVQRVRKDTSKALNEMFAAAKKDGHELYGASGYRSYAVQKSLFNGNVRRYGSEDSANYLSAKAGQSEHQTGLAMDLTVPSLNYQLQYKFEETPEGQWVAENCWKYGFILRYPKDKTTITGYSFEPWHVRYVGKDLAKYLYENDLALEEFYGCSTRYTDYGASLKPDDESYE